MLRNHFGVQRAVALCLSLVAQHVRAAPGDIVNIGTAGGDTTVAFDMSGAGHVVGEFHTPTGNFGAFRYDPGSGGGVTHNLGTLGGTNAYAWAVNALGQVAGLSHTSGNASQHAFRYLGTPGQGGVMQDLGTLGGSYGHGRGINDMGIVVGNSSLPGDLMSHAFRYDGVMRDLGVLPGSGGSVARDINNSGQIVGESSHAFLYEGIPGSGGVMHDLGTLGGSTSAANAINEVGQVTGYSAVGSGLGMRRHAFRYDGTPGVDGVMRDLGTLNGEETFGEDVNNAGFVVGTSTRAGNNVPVLWLLDGSIVDLDAWLDSVNPVIGASWFLGGAIGITDNGMVAGTGVYNDGPGGMSDGVRAFVLDVSSFIPEPAIGSVMLALAFAGTHPTARAPR